MDRSERQSFPGFCRSTSKDIPLKVLGLIVAIPLVLILAVFGLGSLLPPSSPEERLAFDRDTCAYRAGIRKDTPLMYETTKTLYYGAYVQCILDCGYRTVLPLP